MANEISQEKYDELKARLNLLETHERKAIADAIESARSLGDLSENYEYTAAKERQGKNESEIIELTEMIAHATILDKSAIDTKKVSIGNKLVVLDMDFNDEIKLSIVNTLEVNLDNENEMSISNQSPIGKALIGKKKNDIVTVETPNGKSKFKIISISK